MKRIVGLVICSLVLARSPALATTVPTTFFASSTTNNCASVPGLVAWYDGSNATSITQSGGAISQQNDLSGNSHTLTQSGAGKPTVSSGTAPSGLNAVSFAQASSQYFTLGSTLSPANWTIVVTNKITLGASYGMELFGNSNLAAGAGSLEIYGAGYYTYAAAGTAGTYNPTGTATVGWHEEAATFIGGTSSSIQVDNGSVSTTTTFSPAAYTIGWNAFGIGDAGGYNNGLIGEICLYNAALTAPQLLLLYNYLHTKWGTP